MAQTVELARRVVETAEAVNGVVAQVLTELDVAPSTVGVLWALGASGAPPTMRDLAGRLGCDPSTISLTADRLESAGFLTREPHPSDGRKRILVLTERGREVWHEVGVRLHASPVLAGLDAAERGTLVTLLARVRA